MTWNQELRAPLAAPASCLLTVQVNSCLSVTRSITAPTTTSANRLLTELFGAIVDVLISIASDNGRSTRFSTGSC